MELELGKTMSGSLNSQVQQDLSQGMTRNAEVWLQDAKDAFLTKDMQEALATVS